LESESEDSEMEEDTTAPRVGTVRDFADEGRERTANSTENSGTEGSPERGGEDVWSDRGERPPELGTTHSSTFRSSPTPRSRAFLDHNRSRHRNNSTQGRSTTRNDTGAATGPAIITTAVRSDIAPAHTRTHGRAIDSAPTHATDPAHAQVRTHGRTHGRGTTMSTSTTTTRGASPPALVHTHRPTLAEMRARYLAPADHTVPRRVGELTPEPDDLAVAAVVGVQMLEEPDTTATNGTARPMTYGGVAMR
jgi:hypothetical protein